MKQIINFLKCHKLASIAILCVLIAAVTLCILLNQNKKTTTTARNQSNGSKRRRDFSNEARYHVKFRY